MSRTPTACSTNYSDSDPTKKIFIVEDGEQVRIWFDTLTSIDSVTFDLILIEDGAALQESGCGWLCAEPGSINKRSPYQIDCKQVILCAAGGGVIWIDQPGKYELIGTGPSFINGSAKPNIESYTDAVVTEEMRYKTCCEPVVPPADADVAVVKSQSDVIAIVDDPFTYTLIVSNNGPDTALGVSVADVFPPNFDVNNIVVVYAGGASGAGFVSEAQLTSGFVITTLPVGGTATFTINGSFNAPSAGAINSSGLILPPNLNDPNLSNNSDSTAPVVVMPAAKVIPQVDVSVQKTQSALVVNVGAPFTYTVTVSNAGPGAADNTQVVDLIPINFSVTSIIAVYAGGATGPIIITNAQIAAGVLINQMPAGSSVVYTIDGFFTAAGNGYVNNAGANVAPDVNDTNPANNSDSTPAVTVNAVNQLVSINKVPNTNNALVGDVGFYQISISNIGVIAANNSTIYDVIPAGFAVSSINIIYAGGAAGPASTTQGILAAGLVIPLLPVGGSLVITINGVYNQAGVQNNTANIVTQTGQVTSVSPSVTVIGIANLGVIKSANKIAVQVGEPITFTAVITNAGPSSANNAVLTDVFPPTFIPTSITLTYAGGASGPLTATAAQLAAGLPIPVIPAGGSVSITVQIDGVFSDVNQSQTNTMSITPPPGTVDPDNSNNSSTTQTITISLPVADIAVNKNSGEVTNVNVGDSITYMISIINNGPDSAGSPVITDVLPNEFVATSISLIYAGGAAGPASVSQAQLAAGVTISTMPVGSAVQVLIDGNYNAVGSYINTASCFANQYTDDPNLANNTYSSPVVTVSDVGALCPNTTISATVTPNSFTQSVPYSGTIYVDDATSIDAVNGLPPGISYSVAPNGLGKIINLSGIPASSGVYNIFVNATNACGGVNTTTTSINLVGGSLTGAAPPALCFAPQAFWGTQQDFFDYNFVFGIPFAYSFQVINTDPLVPANIVGLPSGIMVTFIDQPANVATVFIGGTPTASGPYNITVDTTNSGNGSCIPNVVVGLLVRSGTIANDCAAPFVSSTISPNNVSASAFLATFDIGVVDTTSATISGLPAGFTSRLDSNSGLLQAVGVPSPPGVYPLTVNLTNHCTSGPDVVVSVSGGTLTIT